jgi:integrase/recombinase XerD
MKWEECKKGYENYLKLEKSLSQNSIAAYINDINKLENFFEKSFKGVNPENAESVKKLCRMVK